MRVESVNASGPKPIRMLDGRAASTGIMKTPVAGRARVGALGVHGDVQVAKKHHGGPDQAVYVYTSDDYAWWAGALGEPLDPGTFGENLTVSGVESALVRVGDRFRAGTVLLEATAPRIPCGTLAARMNDRGFVKRFQQAGRPGFYARVLEEGEVGAGDAVTVERAADGNVTMLEAYRLWLEGRDDEAALRRALESPLAERYRRDVRRRLAALAERAT